MKYLIACVATLFLLAQCQQSTTAKETAQTSVQLVSEELEYYPMSELDSVYSVKVKLGSVDSVVVKYTITLTQQLKTFSDSLVFDIAAGEEVSGQIIFPDCRVKNQSRPSFNSKITILEN